MEGKIDWQGGPVKFVGIIQATGVPLCKGTRFRGSSGLGASVITKLLYYLN